jgi:hypothetical protein
MRCEEVRKRFADRLTGSLDAAHDGELREHLASCADCQAELADVEALWQALGDAPVPLVPSNRMRERFSAALAAERASTDRRPASRPVRGRTWTASLWPGEPLVQMAIAASLLIVGVLVGRALPAKAPAPAVAASGELAGVRSELRDMRQMLTLSLLQQQSAADRLQGVNWTARIDQPGNEIVSALLDTLLHDQNVNVRLAAVDALRRFSDRPDVRLGTKEAIGDRSLPMLQVAVIDFMIETRDPQAPALLRELAQNTSMDESVRGRARWGLERLSS